MHLLFSRAGVLTAFAVLTAAALPAQDTGKAEAGKEIFTKYTCYGCHGFSGQNVPPDVEELAGLPERAYVASDLGILSR